MAPRTADALTARATQLWNAAYSDYMGTVDKLKKEKSAAAAKYGGKLNGVVGEMQKGLNKMKTLNQERKAVEDKYKRDQKFWEDEAKDAATQTEALQQTYSRGFEADLSSQHKQFYRAEKRGKDQLDLIINKMHLVKNGADRTRAALRKRIDYNEAYYTGMINQVERERDADVKKVTTYDKKRQARALKIERQSLADAMALQLRVKDTVDVMYQELDNAAEKVVKVVQARAKQVDTVDAATMNTEGHSISRLE